MQGAGVAVASLPKYEFPKPTYVPADAIFSSPKISKVTFAWSPAFV